MAFDTKSDDATPGRRYRARYRSGALLARALLLGTAICGLAGAASAQSITYTDGQINTAPVTVSGGGAALTVNAGQSATQEGAITGTGDLTKDGDGTLYLTGSSSFTGGTFITGGTLQVSNGGTVASNSPAASFVDVQTGLIVTGPGSAFTTGLDFVMGRGLDAATVTVRDGAHLTTGRSFLGEGSNPVTGSQSSVIAITVDGAGSVWDAGSFLQLSAAAGGTASLTISNGAVMKVFAGGSGAIGRGSNGTALVTGAGSQLLLSDELDIGTPFDGGAGHGQVTIADGALVSATTVAIAFNDGVITGQTGALTVSGTAGARGVLQTASLMRGFDDGSALFDGGILRATASSATFIHSYGADFVTIGAGGMFIDTNGFDETAASGLMGSGTLTKTGAGTLTLTGANSYGGGTVITAGILQLGDSGITGSITGDVVDNAALLFNRSDSVTFGGAVSGSGAVSQIGTGTTILTGTGSFTGGTTIAAGILQLGDGGTTGSIAGNVADNSALAFNRSDTVTFAGAISGGGNVIQMGGGNLILTANNTYTGGTVIAAGTLTGSATSFGTGAITDKAALVIDQPGDAAFANAIAGTGSFTKQGAGRLDYTGTGTLTGTTTVAAGLLSVNGSLAASAVTVQSGATLGGNGMVGAVTALSGGAIAPGNSIGTLHIQGAYTQATGSVYQVQVDPNSNASDLIAASGPAVLQSGAGLTVAKDQPGAYRTGARYTVLHADGGVTGTYSLSGDTALSPYLGLRDSYDTNNVYLSVVQTADPAAAAQTPNQTATATNGLPDAGPVASAVLNTQDQAATRNAFDALSGEALASAKTVLISSSVLLRDTTFGRLRDVFCAGEPRRGRPDRVPCPADRPSLWTQGFGDWGHVHGDGNTAGLSQTTGGFLVGVDVPVWDWRVGVFGGYSRGDFAVDARASSGGSNNYHLGAYGATRLGDVDLRLGGSYSWSGLDTQRLVVIDTFSNNLSARYSAGTAQVFGEIGSTFQAGSVSLEPFANLAYVGLNSDGFRETGGDAALTVRADTVQQTISTLGIRPATKVTIGSVNATLHGMAGWRHTFGDVTPRAIASFAGNDPFTVEGAGIARNAGVVEAGLGLDVSPGAAIGLTYGGRFSNRETDNSIRGTLSFTF